MTSKDNIGIIHRVPTIQHILKQSDFDNYVAIGKKKFTLQHFCFQYIYIFNFYWNFIIVTMFNQLKDFSAKEV
jgi:hypothetical protein